MSNLISFILTFVLTPVFLAILCVIFVPLAKIIGDISIYIGIGIAAISLTGVLIYAIINKNYGIIIAYASFAIPILLGMIFEY